MARLIAELGVIDASSVLTLAGVVQAADSGPVTHAASGDISGSGATVSGEATREGSAATHEASGALSVNSATIAGEATRTGVVIGTFATPPIKNNTGTLIASVGGWTVNVYNVSTGALVVQKTGLSTDASGVLTITDSAIVADTTYAYEPVHTTYGRRLPTAVSA